MCRLLGLPPSEPRAAPALAALCNERSPGPNGGSRTLKSEATEAAALDCSLPRKVARVLTVDAFAGMRGGFQRGSRTLGEMCLAGRPSRSDCALPANRTSYALGFAGAGPNARKLLSAADSARPAPTGEHIEHRANSHDGPDATCDDADDAQPGPRSVVRLDEFIERRGGRIILRDRSELPFADIFEEFLDRI